MNNRPYASHSFFLGYCFRSLPGSQSITSHWRKQRKLPSLWAFGLVFLAVFGVATNAVAMTDYAARWKQVDAFERKARPQSALEIVETISADAASEKNMQQQYKALAYRAKYIQTLQDNAPLAVVNAFNQAITDATEQGEVVYEAILQSTLAQLYWQYFNQNRYLFLNRTAQQETTEQQNANRYNATDDDFRTWDLQRLMQETARLYDASLTHAHVLQRHNVADMPIVFETGLDAKDSLQQSSLRPRVYDVLAHRALDFYRNDTSGLTKPANHFQLLDAGLFAPAKTFSREQINSYDTQSHQLKALRIYQQLLASFPKRKFNAAKLDVDLSRLAYVHQNSIHSNKDALYIKALERLLKTHDDALALRVVAPLAAMHYQLGSRYVASPQNPDTQNNADQWQIKAAVDLIDRYLAAFPKAPYAENLRAQRASYTQRWAALEVEKYVLPKRVNKALVRYRNVDTLYVHVIAVDYADVLHVGHRQRKAVLAALVDAQGGHKTGRYLKKYTVDVPNLGDYQTHSFEILLDALGAGAYWVVASTHENLHEAADHDFSHTLIQASPIAYVSQRTHTGADLRIVHREHGQPLAGAQLELNRHHHQGSGAQRTYRIDVTERLQADAEGLVRVAGKRHTHYPSMKIRHDGVETYFDNASVYPANDRPARDQTRAFIFTDRSIYRPQQTVHFKAVLVEKLAGEASQLIKDTSLTIYAKDANGKVFAEQTLTTNAFGSVAGTFTLPAGKLNGQYSLSTSEGGGYAHYFSVESYKRPRFEAKFDAPKDHFTLNDTVTVTGHAQAYAGSHISDAQVNYTITRQAHFPFWYWGCGWRLPQPQADVVMATGQTTTDATGAFSVDFVAQPDMQLDKTMRPVFTYSVQADITDINGETRSANTKVRVGYSSMDIMLDVVQTVDSQQPLTFDIQAQNLNQQPVAAQGTVQIHKLTPPSTVKRPRPWAVPDQQPLSASDYAKWFAHETIHDISDHRQWPLGAQVYDGAFSVLPESLESSEASEALEASEASEASETQSLDVSEWQTGWYVVAVKSRDSLTGEAIEKRAYVQVTDQNARQVADNQLLNINVLKPQYAVGEVAEIQIGSAANAATVYVDVSHRGKRILRERVRLNNSVQTLRLPITDAHRGGLTVNYAMVKFNHVETGQLSITVPYDTRALSIETATFRDHLTPGGQERWTFTIKGEAGEQVAAELLAAMYDKSLDQFKPHRWHQKLLLNDNYYSNAYHYDAGSSFGVHHLHVNPRDAARYTHVHEVYPHLNVFGLYLYSERQRNFGPMVRRGGVYNGGMVEMLAADAMPQMKANAPVVAMASEPMNEAAFSTSPSAPESAAMDADDSAQNTDSYANANMPNSSAHAHVPIRSQLQETAFFYPQLHTNADGEVAFSFTVPESLTQWQLKLFAHDAQLAQAQLDKTVMTQKELMVLPNVPRFLRIGDDITLSTKIANLTEQPMTGTARIELLDATTMQPITAQFTPDEVEHTFTVDANGNATVDWFLHIPEIHTAVLYRVVASAGQFSDGEEHPLPILSNRQLVTESLALSVTGGQTQTASLKSLAKNSSPTLVHHQLTLEVTSNPTWYAVQALPYLMEYPHQCAEQTFSRYYANALASHIANSQPRLRAVFDQWREYEPSVLRSQLEKNEALKSVLLEETPWVRDAENEAEQKRRIALLFDLNQMQHESEQALERLETMQLSSGAWPWFDGGRDNRVITQHIVTGLAQLAHLVQAQTVNASVTSPLAISRTPMLERALDYLDAQLVRDYQQLLSHQRDLNERTISATQVQYFYARSFFYDYPVPAETQTAFNYYQRQMAKFWPEMGLYSQALAALALHRTNAKDTAQAIVASLKERSITHPELGMYWKDNTASWSWYRSPIETQAMMITVFEELTDDSQAVAQLKTWLLKHKQTNRWPTTKATANAVYALLLRGTDWLANQTPVQLTLGAQAIDLEALSQNAPEAGTGYTKVTWPAQQITPDMAEVTLTKSGQGIAWGSVYWQYFETLDNIKAHETPLSLTKRLFKTIRTDAGERLVPLNDGDTVAVGDKLTVRIELRSDRDMEFLHMKDMRAAGTEPVQVLSGYQWQDGLGYYQSTKDAATHFFFDRMPKGVYVFEYPLRVSHAGAFSNGITSIESMYAPEFRSHSNGTRLIVQP